MPAFLAAAPSSLDVGWTSLGVRETEFSTTLADRVGGALHYTPVTCCAAIRDGTLGGVDRTVLTKCRAGFAPTTPPENSILRRTGDDPEKERGFSVVDSRAWQSPLTRQRLARFARQTDLHQSGTAPWAVSQQGQGWPGARAKRLLSRELPRLPVRGA